MQSRIIQPISTSELERRKKETCSRMKEQGLDLLLIVSNSMFWSANVRYFTNYLTIMYPEYLLLSVDGDLVFIGHYGLFAEAMKNIFGIKESYNIPPNPTRSYAIDGEYVANLVKKMRPNTVGIVGFSELSAAFYQKFLNIMQAQGVSVVDATDLVEEIRVVKSEEEIRLIRKCAAITDAAVEECIRVLKPGIKERDVLVAVDRVVEEMGSEEQYYMIGSAPPGERLPHYCINLANRTIQKGDVVRILVEISGPGGYYTEIGRMFCLGPIPQPLKDHYDVLLEAHRKAVEKLRPSVKMSEVYRACVSVLDEAGFPRLTALYGHGQGLDVVEKPFIDAEDQHVVRVGMNIAVHPSATSDKATAFFCDNYIVNESGAERLQKTPQEIITV